MNFYTSFYVSLLLVATAYSETTTTTPDLEVGVTLGLESEKVPEIILNVTDDVETATELPANPKDPKSEEELPASPEVKSIPIQLGEPNPVPNQFQQPMNPNIRHYPPYHPGQYRVPPVFVRSFKPSFISNPPLSFASPFQQSSPIFDASLCPQGPSLKRDLERPAFHYGDFYLNMKNQDVLFSICGSLAPAHVVLIESASSKFGQFISGRTKNGTDEPIVINDISDLLDQLPANASSNSSLSQSSPANDCLNPKFEAAFKIFLKYFYFGGPAFEEIQNLDVGILVWKLGVAYLDAKAVHQQIEPQIGNLISLDNLGKVYKFASTHQIGFLTQKWMAFISANSHLLAASDRLPLICSDIAGDIEYLDKFIEALNVNQSLVISYIRQYLNCPESANFQVSTRSNPFPRSLLYFRCTIADLKELINIGFLTHETYAEELENRLTVSDRQFEKKCAAKYGSGAVPHHFRHVMPLGNNLDPSSSLGMRA